MYLEEGCTLHPQEEGSEEIKADVEVPWDTLNVTVAEITYGGRVTDIWDKRAIASIMRKYFIPELIDGDYKFSESGKYYAPETDLEGVREYITSLPTEDPPEVFGLDDNADTTFQQKETRLLLESVVTSSGMGGGDGGGSNQDEEIIQLAEIILERLPKPFDNRNGHHETFKKDAKGSMNSLGVFLSQELVRFNGLIQAIEISLRELIKAIKGIVVMSGDLESMLAALLFQRVPKQWEDAGYPCLKPLNSWIEDFFERLEFMDDWLRQGPRISYWLPGFFFPQGFMTAVKQTYSRNYKIAVDTLMVGCEFLEMDWGDLEESPKDGVYIHGLFMEGGRFDRDDLKLDVSFPKELFDTIPAIWLVPVKTEEYDIGTKYRCPLYKTSTRAGTLSTTGHSTNFVVALDVPTDKEQDFWIRRGCAMLCMLDD